MKALFALCVLLFAHSAQAAPKAVEFETRYKIGTIVVRTKERQLYLVDGYGVALRYSVGVGRVGRQWSGASYIDGKYVWPAWQAPKELAQQYGSRVLLGRDPKNPMGARALTLTGGKYAIHGTHDPSSIGKFVSAGCIRMYNHDVVDLFERVKIGAQVVVEQ